MSKRIDFDYILSEVGDYGTYQIVFFFLICIPANLPSAFSAYNIPFVVANPAHKCHLPDGKEFLRPITNNTKITSCKQYNETQVNYFRNTTSDTIESFSDRLDLVGCEHGWDYDNSTYLDSLVTEFNLVCDQEMWIEIATTAFYVGSFIGNCLFGYIADKFGRRRSFFLTLAIMLIFGTASSYSQNAGTFTVLRFFLGFGFPALYQIPFIICMEFMGKSARIFSGLLCALLFGGSMALLGVVAMFHRRWRELTFICNAPFIALFSYYFFLPESPRWSVSVGRWDEAKINLRRIARMNKRNDVDVDQLIEKIKNQQNEEEEVEAKRSHNVLDLFKTPNLRKKTLLITYIWVMNAIIYNGLTLNVSNLPVDDYWSFIINGAIEMPGYFAVWPLMQYYGRRWTLAATMMVCGVGCVSAMFVPDGYPWLVASASFIGKFGVGAGFGVVYIFAGELYPTVVRAIGMGMSSMVAGSGLLLAPHIVKLGRYMKILPLIVMGLMALSAGILTFFLPETLGEQMPMSIEDAENFGRSKNDGLMESAKKREARKLINSKTDIYSKK